MGEKKMNNNLNYLDPEDLEGGAETGTASLIVTGKHAFQYARNGLQTSSIGGCRTTLYAFRIVAPYGKVIG